ncbi:hypothetical protein [Kaistia defluvii]|uniref:IrrE N-terminal-like domain-containing protein n=1 Tax=Kaistia defluvii TaxID=410841 RepID=A0ABV2R0Z9_9HYPH
MEEIEGYGIQKAFTRLRKSAIALFGPPVENRPVTGFFYDQAHDVPKCAHDGPENLSIHLTPSTKSDRRQRQFQLSHEVVHTICRGQKLEAPLIEEGAAVYFSYTHDTYPDGYLSACLSISPPWYLVAADLYDRLTQAGADAILRLREKQPILDEVVEADILATVEGVSMELAECLLLPLSRWSVAIGKGQADPERGRDAITRWILQGE